MTACRRTVAGLDRVLYVRSFCPGNRIGMLTAGLEAPMKSIKHAATDFCMTHMRATDRNQAGKRRSSKDPYGLAYAAGKKLHNQDS